MDETILILVLPDDTADMVVQKVIQAGATRVQLLVPEGARAFQIAAAAARLREVADASGIEITLISSDETVLAAARQSQLQTMAVRGASVRPPSPGSGGPIGGAALPAATIVQSTGASPAAVAPTNAPGAPSLAPPADTPLAPPLMPTSPLSARTLPGDPRAGATTKLASALDEGDAAFLQALDDLDAAPTRHDRQPGLISDAEELEQALDGLVHSVYERSAAGVEHPDDPLRSQVAADLDDDIAGALDRLNTEATYLPGSHRPVPLPSVDPRRLAPEPPPAEDEPAPTPRRATTERTTRPARRPDPAPEPRRRPSREGGLPDPTRPRREPEEAAPRNAWLLPGLAILLLLLLLAIAVVLFSPGGPAGGIPGLGGQVTVRVSPPIAPELIEPVDDLPLPIVAPGAGGGGTAVEAAPIAAEVRFSTPGDVAAATLTPVGTAGGTLSVLSLNNQALSLPAGTEFIALKPDGQQVPFISTADVLVPAASTTDQGTQIVTTRGQASVPVQARSPGSASNVDPNTVVRMAIPGGTTFNVDSGSLTVRHEALTGGSEAQLRIVKDADVEQYLGAALSGLQAEAARQLGEQARSQGLRLEESTATPSDTELARREGFSISVDPPVGQTLGLDAPGFTLTVQAPYSALATPPDLPLEAQIQPVLTELLRQAGLIEAGDCKAPSLSGWRWDGASLFVSSQLGPNPACGGQLAEATRQQVREAVRGKSRAEAEAALQALVAQGAISAYQLPADIDQLPAEAAQISVSSP